MNEYYTQETTSIKGAYDRAVKQQDAEGKAKAIADFKALQVSKGKDQLKRQPLSDLLRSAAQQRKREHGVVGGVETTKSNRRMVQSLLFADSPAEVAEIMADY